MFYPGPDRYGGYERRPPPPPMREYSDPYAYGYPPQQQLQPPPPPPRDYYGMPPADPYRMRMMEPVDQGEELLDRLEQTGRVPSKDKFRRMACMTFVSTGVCPYNDRCVFMHDFRIKAENARVRTTRQTKANNLIKDTFYWPDMTRRDICRYLDAQGLPDANQRYVIPESFASSMSSFHNRGLYSIWNHFVEFCVHNSRLQEERRAIECDNFFQVSNYLGNRHIFGTYRLKIFVHLSMVVETTAARGRLDTSFGSGVTSKEGALSPSVGGSPYSFGTVTTPGGRQMMEGSYAASLFTPSPHTPPPLPKQGGKQQKGSATQSTSPQQRTDDFALVGFPSAPSQDVRLAPSSVGNMRDGDFFADTPLSAPIRHSGSGLGSPSPVMNFEAQRGEPQRRGGESYLYGQQRPDATGSASPRSLGSTSSYSLLLDSAPALYGGPNPTFSPARGSHHQGPAGAQPLPLLNQHGNSPRVGNAPHPALVFPDSRHFAPSRGPPHWSADDLGFQMVQAPRRLFSVSEDDEADGGEAGEELSEEDELMAANTRANYLLSRSSEHLQQAGAGVSAGQNSTLVGSLVSPKAASGKSVVWADAQRAKLEHWEGESATSVASAEDEEDSTSSLSADSYHPAERRLHRSSSWEALDLAQQRAQEASASSAAWDRLPELQRATTSALFGDSIEDAAFELEQALDADDAQEDFESAGVEEQTDEEWLAQQIQRSVVAPTPSTVPSLPAKEDLLDLAFIESRSDLGLLAGGTLPSPALGPGGAGRFEGHFWDDNADPDYEGGALLSPVPFSTSTDSEAALWHPEVTTGSAAPDLAALLGLEGADSGPPSPIEKPAGTAGAGQRFTVSSPLTP